MLHLKSLISSCNTSVSNKLLGPEKEIGKKGSGKRKEKVTGRVPCMSEVPSKYFFDEECKMN